MPSHINWDNLPDSALIREREILPLLPFSHATMWRRVKDGSFPKPVKISRTMTAWQWGKVKEWLTVQAGGAR